jgi:hypothetical protein
MAIGSVSIMSVAIGALELGVPAVGGLTCVRLHGARWLAPSALFFAAVSRASSAGKRRRPLGVRCQAIAPAARR